MRTVRMLAAFIVLALPAWAAAEEKTAEASAKGRILSIERDPGRLTVLTGKGELELRIDEKTTIRYDDRKAKFEKLRVGDAVKVRYERGGEKAHRALELDSDPTTAREVAKEVKDALQAAGKFAYREKEQYQRQMADVMRDLDAQIDKLGAQASDLAGDARERYGKEIAKLKERRKAVGRELEQAGTATAETWEDVKKGLSAVTGELGDAIDKLFGDSKPKEKN